MPQQGELRPVKSQACHFDGSSARLSAGLQRSAGASSGPPGEPAALQNLWEQTKASGDQRSGAIALGLANLVGVGVLGGFLRRPDILYSLANSSLGFVVGLMPLLQVRRAELRQNLSQSLRRHRPLDCLITAPRR